MRPLYLSIKGFGPYVKAEISEEDFAILTSYGLFLISGEIGAGKTTLFDAIVYALFGEGSLQERPPKDMISHILKSGKLKAPVIPEVSFKFFLDGKTYQITRRLPFQKVSEKVSLWMEGTLLSTKKNEIKEKIKELIGLDGKQFKKVFLIPQGEYREILLAKGEERKRLFENIFETGFYASLEGFLKEKAREIREELKILEEKISSIKSLLGLKDEDEIESLCKEVEQKLSGLKCESERLLRRKNSLDREVKELEKAFEVKREIKRLEDILKTMEKEEPLYREKSLLLKKLEALQAVLPHYENLKRLWKELRNGTLQKRTLKQKLHSLRTQLKELQKRQAEISKKEPEIEKQKQRLLELEKAYEFYKNLKEKEKIKETLKKELEHLNQEIKGLEERKKKLSSIIESSSRLFNLLKEYKDLLQLKEVLQEKISYFEKRTSCLKRVNALEREINGSKSKLEGLKKKKEKLEVLCQAERLVEFLKPGEPCPLCGSKSHPSPLKPSQRLEELKLLEKELKKEENALKRLEEEKNQLKGMISFLNEKLKGEQEKELKKELCSVEEKLSKLNPEIKQRFQKVDWELESLSKACTSVNAEIERAFKELKRIERELEEKHQLFLQKREKLSDIEGALNQFKALWGNDFQESTVKEIKNLKGTISEFEVLKKKVEQQVRDVEVDFLKTQERLSQIQKLLKTYTEDYLREFKKVFSLVKNQTFSSLKELKKHQELLKELPLIKKEVEQFFKEKERVEANLLEKKKEEKAWKGISLEELQTELKIREEELKSVEKELQGMLEELGRLRSRKEELDRLKEELLTSLKKYKELEETFGIVEHLGAVILGKNPLKVSFHSYVLSTFIKLILERANYYFQDFSFGRYKFVSKEIFKKDFSLEVFDIYTGSKREAKTLSGGESFIATLSLALGTSDVILRLSRARPFESLFIDEGFGSLDTNTLEKVVNALVMLGQKSGRVIGIISHLEELKKRFPVILEIKKNPHQGSQIKLVRNI